MSTKLPENKQFVDVSDYARPLAVRLVKFLLPTKIGAYSLTTLFLIVGLAASYLIYINKFLPVAGLLILVKSMLDAADGEIARRRKTPSLVGRYYDSICDFIVNFFLFWAIGSFYNIELSKILLAVVLFELQGSVYNYYYLVKRYQAKGDQTSRILEFKLPAPYPMDNVKLLKALHKIYLLIYGWQDYLIYKSDSMALAGKELPNWFLTMVSFVGLGFQLLVIAVLVSFNSHIYTLDIFIYGFSIYSILLIIIRRLFIK